MARGRLRLSLSEVGLILCIAAVVLAVFVPTFLEQVRTNKILEASEQLQDLSHRTASYYGAVWNEGIRRCLPAPAGPTPASPTAEAHHVDFFAPTALGYATWEALGFQPIRPIRYSYSFLPPEAGCELGAPGSDQPIIFRAEGDLDADGVRSRFELRSIPMLDGELRPLGELHVDQRVE